MTLDKHHIALYLIALALLIGGGWILHEWVLDNEIAKIKSQAKDQVIAEAAAREAQREKEFAAQVAEIRALKSTPKTTVEDVSKNIPKLFPELAPTVQQHADTTIPPALVFDAPQAKLLNDRLADCRICDAERAKLKQDLADEQEKLNAMTDERNTWRTAAKGGSLWTRTKRTIKWIAIGAAVGYVISKH